MRARADTARFPARGSSIPAVLARIGNLDLLARTVVDGFINGLHHSPYFGASVDFAEHRGYMPGDDIRRIDWRRLRPHRRFYVKEFEADSNANFTVLLDVSRSMRSARSITKLDYAKTLAACLAYLAHKQRDRVGLVTFDSDVVDHVPPSAKHLDVVLHTLDRARPTRPGQLSPPLRKLAEPSAAAAIVVLISDLYEEPEAIFEALAPLRFRGSDVIVFHVLDPAELEFPFNDAVGVRGPGERRAAAGRARVVPRASTGSWCSAHIAALTARPPSAGRLPPARHLDSRSTTRSTTTCRPASARCRIR